MKIINKLGIGITAASLLLSACTKDFEELNTNPQVSPTTNPEALIVAAEKKIVDRDFEWYYDNYQYIMRWMQFTVADPSSSGAGSLFGANSNTNGLYNDLYNTVGRYTSQIQSLVNAMSADEKVKYQNVVAIAQIVKVYTAWRVSDNNGSIPYTQAWQARDNSVFTPEYDSQEELFAIWDTELKAAVTTLGSALTNQVAYGSSEVFYSGNPASWAKAGNVLRLKLAMRQLKRAPAKTAAIATDVLASTAGLFASNDEEWKFISNTTGFARSGNWATDNNPFVAAKNIIDFLYDHSDPRLRLFYEQNDYRATLIDSLVQGGALAAGTTYNPRRYVGLPSSADAKSNTAYANLYSARKYTFTLGGTTTTATYDTLSSVQLRLFDLDKDGAGAGNYTQPIATYAEMCFILSELSLKGVITQDAQSWYEKGVTASIKAYDKMGALAAIRGYSAVTDAEITAYLQNADVAFTGTDDQKLEKIGVQNFLNHFKAPQEAWGSWKRTGYPKEGGILSQEAFYASGVKVTIPRRWMLPQPATNDNQSHYQAAITEMKATGEYGEANAITGRIWWDMQ